MDQLVCLWGAPASVYKGLKGGAAGLGEARQESPTPSGSRIPPPPNPSWNRIRGGGKRERGAGPLSLSYSDQGRGGARGPCRAASSLFH